MKTSIQNIVLEQSINGSLETTPVCLLLKKARAKKNITLQKVQENTGIALHHLHALEECRFNDLPHGAARRSIIKEYGKMIGLETSDIEFYQHKICPTEIPLSSLPLKKRKTFFISTSWRTLVLIACALFITSYLGFEVQAMIAPPALEILYPTDKFETSNTTITLKGSTAPESIVTVNGVRLAVSRNGIFSENIHLKEGINEILVTSASKRGGQANISRTVFYTP